MGSTAGSRTILTTICATRSATVGMPRMRSPPFFFGMATAFTGVGKYVPDDIRFQIRYRLLFNSDSKSSIVSLSTPAEPALALTAFQASNTNSLGMTNGFVALTHLLLLPVGFEMQRLDPCRGRGAARAVPPHGSGLAAFPHPALVASVTCVST